MTFIVDAAIWTTNVLAAVSLIFVNKLLLSASGSSFNFAVTLSGLHYLTVAQMLQLYKWSGNMAVSKAMNTKSLILYCSVSSASIISLNVSLMINQVGFYQISKLMVIPFVCVVEAVAYKRVFSPPVMASIAVVVGGVGLVTVSSVAVHLVGFLVAALSIVAAGSQQLLCGHMQRTTGISSTDMLLQTAWPMGISLLVSGPLLDHTFTGKWVHEHIYDLNVNLIILATCALALAVNVSQFLCLGRFSAVAYQVMGHSKTITVLIGGAVFFREAISPKAALGMTLAVAGMVGYGYISSKEKAAPAEKPPAEPQESKESAEQPLLSRSR